MLSQNEKDILGIMVDTGHLKGEERASAGASDEVAREVIAIFKERMMTTLPQQLESALTQKYLIDTRIAELQNIITTLEIENEV